MKYSILQNNVPQLSGVSRVTGTKEIDGGKVLTYIHEFRPPRGTGNFTLLIQQSDISRRNGFDLFYKKIRVDNSRRYYKIWEHYHYHYH